MSLSIQSILDTTIKTLDRFIKTLDIVLNSLYKLLEYLIKTFEDVSKKILNLLTNVFRVLFYVLPFLLMILIGHQKDWKWMTLTGWTILILVMILFLRDFMAAVRGISANKEEEKSIYSKRGFYVVLILNILLASYSVSFYLVGISPEKCIVDFFSGAPKSSKAESIRESIYINMLENQERYQDSQIMAAIDYLGKLKSQKAKPLLIMRLNSIKSDLDKKDIELIMHMIGALGNIGGSDACSTLVNFEINCNNSQLKQEAHKVADRICGK